MNKNTCGWLIGLYIIVVTCSHIAGFILIGLRNSGAVQVAKWVVLACFWMPHPILLAIGILYTAYYLWKEWKDERQKSSLQGGG